MSVDLNKKNNNNMKLKEHDVIIKNNNLCHLNDDSNI